MLPTPGFGIRLARLLEKDESDRIDAFVKTLPDSTPFHMVAWGLAVEQGCGQTGHVLIAQSGDGQIVGTLALTQIHSPIFGSALASVGFGVGGGILTSVDGAAAPLEAAAIALAAKLRCPTLELRGGVPPDAGWHIDDATYLGFSRPLALDDEAELLAIPRKQRAEVRRALGNGLEIEIGSAKRDRDAHFAVYAESVRNLGTPVFPRQLFAAMLDQFGGAADILTVRRAGKAVASVLSFYHNGTVYPYWGGGTAAARSYRANDLMYYALMLHARKEKGCTRFDFGRSKAGTGPASFKKNWGFEPVPLSYAKFSVDGSPLREINPMNPKYRLLVAAWKKLPLWLANRFGPAISKGLG